VLLTFFCSGQDFRQVKDSSTVRGHQSAQDRRHLRIGGRQTERDGTRSADVEKSGHQMSSAFAGRQSGEHHRLEMTGANRPADDAD
jgi:hypothetical protein